MKKIVRLTENDLIRLVKRVISETIDSNCSKPVDWLLNYKIGGKLGKQECSEFRWDKNTYEFLAIQLRDQMVFLSISVEDIDEDKAQELANLFKMSTPKLVHFKKYYSFGMEYTSAEQGGDLNNLLNSLQGKIPFLSSTNESFLRKNYYNKNKYF